MKFYELVSAMMENGYSEQDIRDKLGFESVIQVRKLRALSKRKQHLSIYNRSEKLSARGYPDSLIAAKIGISETRLNNIRKIVRGSSAKKCARDCMIRLAKEHASGSDYKTRYAVDRSRSFLMGDYFRNNPIRNLASLFYAVIRGGSIEEIRRITEFVTVCAKTRDMKLDWFQCYIDNEIAELEKKYSIKIRRV